MSYSVPGRIQRGPMAADKFTQIHNEVFRDPTLSAKAKAIFGFVSTHNDGWGVTEASIIAHMAEGRDAVRKALKELEGRGYLVRERTKGEDGKFGAYVWFFTDLPAQLRDAGITDNDVILARVREEFETWLASTKPQVKPLTENQVPGNQVPANPTHKKNSWENNSLGEDLASDDGLASRPKRDGAPRATDKRAEEQQRLLASMGARVSKAFRVEFQPQAPPLSPRSLCTHAKYANALLDAGWQPEALVLILAVAEPADGVRNLGGFITGRLKDLVNEESVSVIRRAWPDLDRPPTPGEVAELLEVELGMEVDLDQIRETLELV